VLAFAPRERLRISRRSGAQQRIVRCCDSVRQHQWIEIDVASGTGILALDAVDRQRPRVDLLPVRRPGQCRISGRISGLTYSDHQMPLQRAGMDARDQRIEQVILAGLARVYVSKMPAWAGSFIFDLFLRLY
jgi:hypothetical protein